MLKAELLNLESFVQASCDLYYLKKRSSFIVKLEKIQSSDFGDYLPSVLPDYLNESGVTPSASNVEAMNNGKLPRLDDDCIDCI